MKQGRKLKVMKRAKSTSHPKSPRVPKYPDKGSQEGHRWLMLADKALNAPESVATVRLEDFPELKAG